jgi:hypothetical protein
VNRYTKTHESEMAAEAGSQSVQTVAEVESSRRPTGSSRAGAGPLRSDYTDQYAAISYPDAAEIRVRSPLYPECHCEECEAGHA